MSSYLTYPSTESFRKVLISRNLKPYTVPGVYTPKVSDITYETQLRDMGVIDSPDDLIGKDPFADLLYPLNAYGPLGGYDKNTNINNLANTKSNLGAYDVMDAKLPELSYPIESKLPTKNIYSSGNGVELYSVSNALFNSNPNAKSVFKPYFDPWSFLPSTYTTYQIYTQTNPSGDGGNLSQDSFIAQLGAKELKKLLIINNSYGKVNALNNKNGSNANGIAAGATDILRGTSNYFSTTYKITIDTNNAQGNDSYNNRLSDVYYPASPIPGDYFQDELFTRYPASIAQLGSAAQLGTTTGILNQYMGPKVIRQKAPSEVFLNNTGSGQSSQLFRSLDYNKYKPNYNRTALRDFAQGTLNVLGVSSNVHVPSNYYVGSSIQDPKYVNSPLGEVPYDTFGRDTEAIVYGPDKMAKLYENSETNRLKFGLNGSGYYDGDGLSGGLVWVSPKYSNVGYHAKIGGDQGSQNSNASVTSQIRNDLSIRTKFKEDSILDNTQKLLDSTPRGGKRLSHVGNAINQLSKVFHDGYKEITKGSKVLTYVDTQSGLKSGTEYCRVFTKDEPYFTYSDLQKKNGNLRKFAYSVLDNTYNLNIAPTSKNFDSNGVKKFMFSIENLAWRTSKEQGLTYHDLPDCEKGPNKGRIMWFPPYDITFNESSTPNFIANNYVGRPEPVYTYTNTTRTGSLSWKIIVDHPSILNLIVNKTLTNLPDNQINSIVDSFFAGCTKYDIYDLAKRYPTIPTSELSKFQTMVNEGKLTNENAASIAAATSSGVVNTATNPSNTNLNTWIGTAYYFDNESPNPKSYENVTSSSYIDLFNSYMGQQIFYIDNAPTDTDKSAVNSFFNDVITYNFNQGESFLNELLSVFENNKSFDGLSSTANVSVLLQGTASPPGTDAFNVAISERRTSSIVNYFKSWNNGALKKYIDNKQLILTTDAAGNAPNDVQPISNAQLAGPLTGNVSLGPFSCNQENILDSTYVKVYSPGAMACRRVAIKSIKVDVPPPTPKTVITPPKEVKQDITKKLIRSLLSECTYFDFIQESDPMFYRSVKKQIQFFNPAFHSTTPEGLNARLTFLQQCMRPGDTIPTVTTDNKVTDQIAINTSFGVPPVLVLRIGDFYNTKIIPTGLQIVYDPITFDINPEGIGVQPMIAKITLNFNFVGGSGLKESISKLQNALSFNYYANTEMYDERAEETDDSYKKYTISNVETITRQQQSPTIVNVTATNQLQNPGGTTLGNSTTTSVTQPLAIPGIFSTTPAGVNSGTTSYQVIMDNLLDDGQAYITSVVNKAQQVISEYNFQIYTAFVKDRNYYHGQVQQYTSPGDIAIVGKPYNVENKIINLVTLVNNDIYSVNTSNDSGLNYIRQLYVRKYPNSVIKKVKENLKRYLIGVENNIINTLSLVNNELTSVQQNLINDFAKIDMIDYLTDGFIATNQETIVYNLTGTTYNGNDTYSELRNDYYNAYNLIDDFYIRLGKFGLINLPYDPNNLTVYSPLFGNSVCCGDAEKRFYSLMSKTILSNDLFLSFINDIITKDIATTNSGGETLLSFTKKYFEIKKIEYRYEYDAEQTILRKFKESDIYNVSYKIFTPYVKGKERPFVYSDYVPGTSTQIEIINNIYKYGNYNLQVDTFNGKNKLN